MGERVARADDLKGGDGGGGGGGGGYSTDVVIASVELDQSRYEFT